MNPGPGKPANDFKNTIDVQLNLLKSVEVDKFNKTVLQFQTAVSALSVLGTVADRLSAAGGGGGSPHKAGTSASQSTAKKSSQEAQTPEDQRQTNEANQGRLQKMQDRLNAGAYSYLKGNESTKTMQNLLMRGELKNWRYKDLAGVGAYGLGHLYYRNANTENPQGSGRLLGAAAGLAGLEATGMGPSHLIGSLMDAMRFQGPTTYGSNAGQSATGPSWLGPLNRYLAPSAWNYYKSGWNALQNSYFGFNPNYSTGQAMQAQGLINQFGYGANRGTAGAMAQTFRNVSSAVPATNQNQIMQMIDMGFRYGASSIQEMQTQMMQIPAAAKAAQLGVSQFTDQLISTATGLAQQSGAPASIVTQQLMGMSSATGLAPALAGGVMGDQLLTNITAARLGGNFFKAANSPFAGAYRMQTVQSMVENVAGTSWKGLQQMQKTNRPAYQAIMNKLQVIYNSPQGKELFGNLSPTNINALIARGQSPASFQMAADALQFAGTHPNTRNSGAESIATIMRNLGMSHSQQQAFLQHNTGDYQSKITALTKVEESRANAMNNRQHSQTVRLALTPNAAKLLQIVPDSNPANRNQQNPSQQAVQFGSSGARNVNPIH